MTGDHDNAKFAISDDDSSGRRRAGVGGGADGGDGSGCGGDVVSGSKKGKPAGYRSRMASVVNVNSDGGGGYFVACRIARVFLIREPSIEDLMREFGMSRATAFRWRAAWKSSAPLIAREASQ